MPKENPVHAALEAALERDPGENSLRKHLASLLLEDGQPETAIRHLTILLNNTPEDGDVSAMLGRAYRTMAERFEPGASLAPPPKAPQHRDEEEAKDEPIDSGPFRPIMSSIKLSDVAGLTSVKQRLENAFLKPYRNPELQKTYGVSGRGGLLLYGPPGCGKTFVAKAVAGELMARFYAINVLDVEAPYFGQSENQLAQLLEMARRNKPSVVFFDEIDALGRKRSLTRESGRSITTVLLEQMDGLDGDNDGMFYIAATNHPWDVDVALRRPGRFDRTIFVAPPDRPAREAILRHNLESRPSENIDLVGLSEKTDRFSGADVKHVVTTAAEYALIDAADGDLQPIQMRHFKKALAEIKPSIRGWLESAKNHALFANDGGQYDDLAEYLKAQRII